MSGAERAKAIINDMKLQGKVGLCFQALAKICEAIQASPLSVEEQIKQVDELKDRLKQFTLEKRSSLARKSICSVCGCSELPLHQLDEYYAKAVKSSIENFKDKSCRELVEIMHKAVMAWDWEAARTILERRGHTVL